MINIRPYEKEELAVDLKLPDGTIVLYLYKGAYRIGVYKKHRLNVELSKDDDN